MKSSTLIRVMGCAGLVLGILCAQPQPAGQEFEVASVRVAAQSRNGMSGGCHGIDSHYGPTQSTAAPPLGRCVITDARLSHLIGIAYDVPMNRIKAAPDWVIAGAERFTVQAAAEDPTTATEKQLIGMLQGLLADRFKLRFHREDKDVPGFVLTVAKKGPKLTDAKGDEVSMSFGGAAKPGSGQPITLIARKYSIPLLTGLLSQIGPGPMIDQTKLSGDYDFTLSWDENAGPSLTTALQEELGLRLEAQKVPVSFFVFESAQRPAEN